MFTTFVLPAVPMPWRDRLHVLLGRRRPTWGTRLCRFRGCDEDADHESSEVALCALHRSLLAKPDVGPLLGHAVLIA